uniref:Phosphoglycerate mutase-like protein AT74H n=1 Tax=Ananas comosus var. bracteatus TaxID=296719 RepID=A0A6V7PFN6_ANACO|nr:unnamed protein product [Ananas comosus var. bracteatus]
MGLNPSLDLNFLVLKDRRGELRHCGGDEQTHPKFERRLPKRIILVRHGESQGNLDMSAYTTTPDYRIPSRRSGRAGARGRGIREAVSEGGRAPGWKVYFYVSPYERTRSTLREIGRAFPKERILGVREECRIREQDFGNFQVEGRMKVIKETRERFGRSSSGSPRASPPPTCSTASQVSPSPYSPSSSTVITAFTVSFIRQRKTSVPPGFMESLWRDIDMKRIDQDENSETNLVIVSHGLTTRVFLMKWFKWTVDHWARRRVQPPDPPHAEELERWGMSPEMIADQQWRATANRGTWNEDCSWYLTSFFDGLEDSEDPDGERNGENEL